MIRAADPSQHSLFRKYFLVLFAAVVIPLLANGGIEAWFGYRDQRAQLNDLLGLEARAAAARIQSFIDNIRDQLGWTVQLPLTAGAEERPRVDALRLLRQVPAIVNLTLVDGEAKERLYVSRWASTALEPARTAPMSRRSVAPGQSGSGTGLSPIIAAQNPS
jgi:hypothetical protein